MRRQVALRMQRPTDNLRADHELTSIAARILCAVAAAVRGGAVFPAHDCVTLLRFLREFVLAVHMRKEDEFLCPAAAMRADDEDAAVVVGELMRLHEEINELTHSLVMFWEPDSDLTGAERCGFAETVDALAARLARRHELEETRLFPICDAAVPADDQLEWQDRFSELERERGDRSSWEVRIEKLAQSWLDD